MVETIMVSVLEKNTYGEVGLPNNVLILIEKESDMVFCDTVMSNFLFNLD